MSFAGSKKILNRRSFVVHGLLISGREIKPKLRGSILCPHFNFFATASAATNNQNPYRVLNIPVNSNYETVKTAFLKAALQHHPDHSKQADTAAFVRVRQAFEEIVYSITSSQSDDESASSTTTTAVKKKTVWKSDAEFQEWFRAATGEFLSFDMNHATRQEVIRVYRTMSSGGKDKGGYWEMARQLAEREDAVVANRAAGSSNDKADPVLGQLSSGGGDAPPSSLRRKRNR